MDISLQPANDYIDPNVPLRLADAIKYGFPQGGMTVIGLRNEARITLRDAALYITKPSTEHDAREWQVAMEALLIIAEHGGPTMFARIGMMRALNWHVERVFESSGKKTHWGSESWRGDLSPIAEVRY